jgi:polysaccharide pyruvyl transferase CsaB
VPQSQLTRKLIVVSGYYGFDNLGDEAILEQLLSELKQLVSPADIRVLSHNPLQTSSTYQVPAVDRFSLKALCTLLPYARLFISGGGGLFQDTKSVGSVLYYAGQLALARLYGVPSLIYAQGLGPLRGHLAKAVTKWSWQTADVISVRDQDSFNWLKSWGLIAQLSADPVWRLEPSELPPELINLHRGELLIGLSLRQSPSFNQDHFKQLQIALRKSLPAPCTLLLLPLQAQQDQELLTAIARSLQAYGINYLLPDTAGLHKPSQWLNLIKQCDFMIGMRLHALIMALKSGIASVGIAYDPKVSRLLTDFEQPILNLTKDSSADQWAETLKSALQQRRQLSELAFSKTRIAANSACQNFHLLARILGA